MPLKKKKAKEKIFKSPKGFIPTAIKQKGDIAEVTFSKFKFGIRQKFAKEKETKKKFKLPKGHKITSAKTIERGLIPRKFRIKTKRK